MQPEILRIKDVIKITRLSRTSIWRYVKSGAFPAPVSLGGPGSRIIGWHANEVKHWLENRPRKTGQVGRPHAA